MTRHEDRARRWLDRVPSECPHLAYRDASKCVLCLAALLAEVERETVARCISAFDGAHSEDVFDKGTAVTAIRQATRGTPTVGGTPDVTD